jgi:hypothetical protein
VSVLTYDAKGEPLISGTGFFIRAGEVVTNMHVIKNAHRVEIHTLEGKGRTYPVAGALAVDDEADLALLRVDLPADRSKPLNLTTSLPDEGEPIFLIGNPLRLEGSVSDGIVSAIREVPDLGRIIQITAPVSHGNSGSPLFNMRGQVIGIVTVKVTNGQNINLALGVSRIAALARGELMSFDQISTRNKSTAQPELLAETRSDMSAEMIKGAWKRIIFTSELPRASVQEFVANSQKAGFMKAALPIQDQLATELGPHAVKILGLVRAVK